MNLFHKIITFRPSYTVRIITGLVCFLAMLGVCFAIGILDIGSGRLGERDINFKARSIEAGAKLYSEQCARCHGLDGEGVDGLGPTLAHISFAGKAEEVIATGNVLELKQITKSKRLTDISWAGSLFNYVRAVTASGVPVKSGYWEVAHPTFGLEYGGQFRQDQVMDVSRYVENFSLKPIETDNVILPPEPGAAAGPKPTAVPLTSEQEQGKKLVVSLGCNACHAIKGVMQGQVGPNLTKIYADSEEIIKDPAYISGTKGQPAATTAEEYIVQSIHYPNAYIYPKCPLGACAAGVMPQNYKDSIKAEDFKALIAYLNTLK